MIEELLKRLSKVDNDVELRLSLSNNGVYTFSVYSNIIEDDLYSYSSTSLLECGNKINKFIDCLEDDNKLKNLIDEILNTPLELEV